jgi:dethiobiotin synthetase
MPRPERLAVVAGTGTEVGKTWVTAALARWLTAAGASVAARKPAQSFASGDVDTDASLLAAATGVTPEVVCPAPRWYPVPLAPPMAADALGRPRITVDDLVAELHWPDPRVDVGLVEGAGGLCSPLAHDGDTLALAERLRPDLVVLVAGPALGVVSNVRLAARAVAGTDLLVVLNRYDEHDDAHRRSLDWLRTVDSLTVATDVASVGRALLAPSLIA